MLVPLEEGYDQPRQHIKKQRHYFANKGPYSQGYTVLTDIYTERDKAMWPNGSK